MKFQVRSLIGFTLVILGIGYFLSAFGTINFSEILAHWWPVLLVVVGLIKMFNKDDSKIFASVLIIMGIFLLGEQLNWYEINVWSLFWPTLLILAGASILSDQFSRPQLSKEREIDISTFFGSVDKRIGTDGFAGGKATAIFGSIEIDLRQAKMLDDASIVAFTGFGTVTIRVAKDCEVVITGTPIFGGVEDHTRRETGDTVSSVLKVHYTTLFGNVEVTN